MGRITQTFIKRIGNELLEMHPKKFNLEFEHNKKVLQELIESEELDCPSKVVRNRLAGYVSRTKKIKSKAGQKEKTFK